MLPSGEDGDAIAGDIRAGENISLTAIQTLFVREHNRIADQIAAANPLLTDEAIYQQARAIVIAELQAITFGSSAESVGQN
ncbi:MAG: peroxidase family protein [Pirellulaceae bacterium]|nr:peroxidase family protein [Pirellulaceae bacterium]